jgi:hypothetical protein
MTQLLDMPAFWLTAGDPGPLPSRRTRRRAWGDCCCEAAQAAVAERSPQPGSRSLASGRRRG